MHFLWAYLVCSKQGKLFENTLQYGKRMNKQDVATRL